MGALGKGYLWDLDHADAKWRKSPPNVGMKSLWSQSTNGSWARGVLVCCQVKRILKSFPSNLIEFGMCSAAQWEVRIQMFVSDNSFPAG